MELGLYTFAEVAPNPRTGVAVDPGLRLRQLVEEAVLADEVGLDVYGVGEHHRPDYVASAPAVVLAAIAARTRRIRLSSAVTVLSSDDPVRVFQQFATLDLLSEGRAEIIAGRGSFIESFPLFGYPLEAYDALFAEKLDLLLALRGSEHVTWQGRMRAPLRGEGVYPRPQQDRLPVWIGVGGNPESAVRAGTLGLPMALAIIGGLPERFAPLVEIYRAAGRAAGHDPASLKVSINAHGMVGDDGGRIADACWPVHQAAMNRLGRERGWPPTTRAQFDAGRTLRGALVMGDPQAVIDKILFQHEIFGHDRFTVYQSYNAIGHGEVLRAIELLGTVVAPAVRKATARAAIAPRALSPA